MKLLGGRLPGVRKASGGTFAVSHGTVFPPRSNRLPFFEFRRSENPVATGEGGDWLNLKTLADRK